MRGSQKYLDGRDYEALSYTQQELIKKLEEYRKDHRMNLGYMAETLGLTRQAYSVLVNNPDKDIRQFTIVAMRNFLIIDYLENKVMEMGVQMEAFRSLIKE